LAWWATKESNIYILVDTINIKVLEAYLSLNCSLGYSWTQELPISTMFLTGTKVDEKSLKSGLHICTIDAMLFS